MLFFVFRCLACVALFMVPMFALIYGSGDPSMAILTLLPLTALLPGLAIALVLFVPTEALCERIGQRWLANIAVPVMGAVGAALTLLALTVYFGAYEAVLRNHAQSPWATYFWIATGVVWGLLWRLTALVRHLPLIGRRLRPV